MKHVANFFFGVGVGLLLFLALVIFVGTAVLILNYFWGFNPIIGLGVICALLCGLGTVADGWNAEPLWKGLK